MLVVLLLLPSAAAAQLVVNATTAEFTPSADHDAISTTGKAVVDSYSLQIYESGVSGVQRSVALGKPTPGPDGLIRVDFAALMTTPLPGGVEYRARVAAIGPGGKTVSDPSNAFTYSTCAAGLSATTASVGAGASTVTVSVTAAAGCPWSATTSAPWLSVTGGASGTGTGVVTVGVAANSGGARVGTVIIAGHSFTVTQAAAALCAPSISPASAAVPAEGGTVTIGVTAGIGCAWTAATSAPWVAVSAGTSGTGSGTVKLTVAANTTTLPRSAVVTVAGQSFSVNQAPSAACVYFVTPTSVFAAAAGLTGSMSISTTPGCGWTASGMPAWVTLGKVAGDGADVVSYTIAANTGTLRSGTFLVAGKTVKFTQAAAGTTAGCVSLTPSLLSAPGAASTGSVDIVASDSCSWSTYSTVSWLTVTSATEGTGAAKVTFDIATNPWSFARTGSIFIGGRTLTVTQERISGCTYSVSPSTRTSPAAGESFAVAVTTQTGCTWTSTASTLWLRVSAGATGTGSGTATVTVGANISSLSRTGSVTIAGQTVTVNQSGAGCAATVTPGSVSATAAGGTGNLQMTIGGTCTWTVTGAPSWLTIYPASGTGSRTLTYTVAANTGASRTATVNVGGQSVTFTQGVAGTPPTAPKNLRVVQTPAK
jgi:hypothetical protein